MWSNSRLIGKKNPVDIDLDVGFSGEFCHYRLILKKYN
tara:strand:- start:6403 stop:6516 length:114 start_codon:yes stop_codon:yes gene_type:complete